MVQSCAPLCDPMDSNPPGCSSPGKNTGVGSHSLLQGGLPDTGIEPHCRQILYCLSHWEAAAAELLQSCPTLRNPIDRSPSGSPIPGILQARPLEWVAISFSSAWKWKVKVTSLSRVRLLATLWTAAYQAPPSMGFSRQEYWSGVPLSSLTGELLKSKSEELPPDIPFCQKPQAEQMAYP